MSSEIEVTETPNWLKELEEKREKRLKAKLGHEAGAGAPCLKCGEKCPGLDLHFWRKCCKICRCSKEEHEVQDDDIYGWTELQLLGNKPSKIKKKIVLPGKNDEIELDWAPKGHNDVVDKYLKTLPPEQLPIKGSQAAQDRKQQLQKQIPVHDIDPTLCHELTEDEMNKMNEYIAHVKKSSVGVGQIINLSSIIKGNLHMLNPNDAALIASRYPKGIPLSEIVRLQSMSKVDPLKHNLTQKMQNMSMRDKAMKNLSPNSLIMREETASPIAFNKIHDISYGGFASENNSLPIHPQYSTSADRRPNMIDDDSEIENNGYSNKNNNKNYNDMASKNLENQYSTNPYFNNPKYTLGKSLNDETYTLSNRPTLHDKFLPNSNFNPKNLPSQFITQHVSHKPNMPGQFIGEQLHDQNILHSDLTGENSNYTGSAFVPYSKTNTNVKIGSHTTEHPNELPSHSTNLIASNKMLNHPHSYDATHASDWENPKHLSKNPNALPHYLSSQYNPISEFRSPTQIPKNVKDLAFSTYDSQSFTDPQHLHKEQIANVPDVKQNTQYSISDKGKMLQQEVGNMKNAIKTNTHNDDGQEIFNRMQPPEFAKIQNQGAVHNMQNPWLPNSKGQDQWNSLPNAMLSNINQHQGSKDNYSGLNYNSPSNEIPLDKQMPNTRQDQWNSLQNPTLPDINLRQGSRDNYQGVDYNSPSNQIPLDKQMPNTRQDQWNSVQNPKILDINQPQGSRYNYQGVDYNSPSNQIPFDKQMTNTGQDQWNSFQNPFLSDTNQHQGSRDNYPGLNYNSPANKILNKPLDKQMPSNVQSGNIVVPEDFLEPSQVSIGAIQDINYPAIKAAVQGTNDFYEDYSPDSIREILNNVKLPDCHYCKKPFEEKEFAVTIDRANVLFHAACFKCAGCNQNLADNLYFYSKENNNIYCGRDYAKIRGIPRCKACDELIFTKEYCLAEDSTFHLKHFCCTECDTPLAGQDYVLGDDDGMPYCLPCFERSKADSCSSCNRVIKPDETGCSLNGIHFHADDRCFACNICHKPLLGQKMLLRNNKLYCSHECYRTAQ